MHVHLNVNKICSPFVFCRKILVCLSLSNETKLCIILCVISSHLWFLCSSLNMLACHCYADTQMVVANRKVWLRPFLMMPDGVVCITVFADSCLPHKFRILGFSDVDGCLPLFWTSYFCKNGREFEMQRVKF